MKSSTGLRLARSTSDLDDFRAFDIKVGYSGRKVIPPLLSSHPLKALVVTMYRNGDAFFPGTKVSLRPGKDFLTFSSFCDFLSQRLKIPLGVRYIFDMKGRPITSLEQLEDRGSYVASGSKAFRDEAYGKLARLKTGPSVPNPTPLRPDEVLLYRPTEELKIIKSPYPVRARTTDEGGLLSLPGSRESCVVTVVNRKEPAKRSRVLLNLKTKQRWEDVLRDMAQAVAMKGKAFKLHTPWGEEVRSFSHLKNDFPEVETFYIDDLGSRTRPHRPRSDTDLHGLGENDSLRVKIPEETRYQTGGTWVNSQKS